jgi:hypothetical protein
MNFMTKTLLGAGAAAAALVSVTVPAQARDRHDRDRDRDRDSISAGEIIAGAVVLGGLAAVLSSGNKGRNDRRGYDDRYDDNRAGYGYDIRNGSGRAAINQCVASVERWANGYSRSDVTQVRSIERTRFGYRVQGNVVVQGGGRGRYENKHYGNDRFGGNAYQRGYDKGRFTCFVERGRVVDINYRGLEQWR